MNVPVVSTQVVQRSVLGPSILGVRRAPSPNGARASLSPAALASIACASATTMHAPGASTAPAMTPSTTSKASTVPSITQISGSHATSRCTSAA